MLRELQERLTAEMLDVLEHIRGHLGLEN